MEDRITRLHDGKRRVQLTARSSRDVEPRPDKNAIAIDMDKSLSHGDDNIDVLIESLDWKFGVQSE